MNGSLGRHIYSGLQAGLVIVALLLPRMAAAACISWGSEFTFPLPATTRVLANTVEIGEALGPWIDSGAQEYMNCGTSGGAPYINYHIGVLPEAGTYHEGGRTYSVFETGAPGIGMVIRVRADPASAGSYLYGAIRSGERVRSGPASNKVNSGLIAIRFIKTGNTMPDSYALPGQHVLDMQHFQSSDRFRQQHRLSAMTLEVDHRPLCRVASKTVPMGLTSVTRLPTVDSYGATRQFTVDLTCETGAGRVRYFVEPAATTTVFDRSRGIVNVEGGAKGVGIQLLGIFSEPIDLDRAYWFGDSAADGARSEKFGARYFRIAVKTADLIPGDANATVRFRIDYP